MARWLHCLEEKIDAIEADHPSLVHHAAEHDQPELINGTLHRHQLTGLSWLIGLYDSNHNGILGDEMGLGKTLQFIALLAHLVEEKKAKGPFLVIAPLSTVGGWHNEFKKFAPTFRVLKYIGNKEEREDMRAEIVARIKTSLQGKKQTASRAPTPDVVQFDVLITTYQLVSKDIAFLSKFHWEHCCIDEAHRLKNKDSHLYRILTNQPFVQDEDAYGETKKRPKGEYKIPHRLLLTGTPLQNNLDELFALFHFCEPELFDDNEEFKRVFKGISWSSIKAGKHEVNAENKDSPMARLHHLMRPFLLRRLKESDEVGMKLPGKREVLIYCGMSKMQKQYYKWILTKNVEKLQESTRKSKVSLMNIVMQLRKCCNHPYLFDGAEPTFDGEYKLADHIIDNSGKLSLLDRLLPKLQEEGHKVLVFSQMTRMLDIVQDYLHYRGYNYERLDGSVRGEERHLSIDTFNEDDEVFVFLLSTRAGGLGLNLTAADTVVFLDSDWNPQADLQAEARVHRIGQTREVTVYRMVAESTVDEIILRRAMRKLKLASAVIESGRFGAEGGAKDGPEGSSSTAAVDINAEQLYEAIKFGVSRVCASEESSIPSADINAILAKSEVVSMSDVEGSAEENAASSGLYVYEGHDYKGEISTPSSLSTTTTSDAKAFKSLVSDAATRVTSDLVSGKRSRRATRSTTMPPPSIALQRVQRKKISPEEALRRKKKKRAADEERWAAEGYTSTSVQLDDSDIRRLALIDNPDDAELAEAEGGEVAMASPFGIIAPQAVQFVSGSVTRPEYVLSLSRAAKGKEKNPEKEKEKGKEKKEDEEATEEGDEFLEDEYGRTEELEQSMEEPRAVIMVQCGDHSGVWGRGGLFDSFESISGGKCSTVYSDAKAHKDLLVGDLHLFPVSKANLSEEEEMEQEEASTDTAAQGERGETGGTRSTTRSNKDTSDLARAARDPRDYYIGLMIAQRRSRGKPGSIDIKAVEEALDKLAAMALRLKASVHLPRIGAHLRNSNWYSVERLIRRSLAARGIPTFVYYFKRRYRKRAYGHQRARHHSQEGGRRGANKKKQKQRAAMTKHKRKRRKEEDGEEDEETQEMLQEELVLSSSFHKKRKKQQGEEEEDETTQEMGTQELAEERAKQMKKNNKKTPHLRGTEGGESDDDDATEEMSDTRYPEGIKQAKDLSEAEEGGGEEKTEETKAKQARKLPRKGTTSATKPSSFGSSSRLFAGVKAYLHKTGGREAFEKLRSAIAEGGGTLVDSVKDRSLTHFVTNKMDMPTKKVMKSHKSLVVVLPKWIEDSVHKQKLVEADEYAP